MKRRLFNLLAVVSLLLCLATVALWVRSYWRFDTLYYQNGRYYCGVMIWDGLAYESGYKGPMVNSEGWSYETLPRGWYNLDYQLPGGTIKFLGFTCGGAVIVPYESAVHFISVPYWFPALLFAILPAIRLRAILRTRRNRIGLCPTCGYDLRATPDRCPECGAVPAR